jgi:hypothetical protein
MSTKSKQRSKKSAVRSSQPKPATKVTSKPKQPASAQAPARTAKALMSQSNTKLGKVIAMLRRKEGATIAQLAKATGWQEHSVRGAISGAIKKKLGLTVTSAKAGDVRTYRIAN